MTGCYGVGVAGQVEVDIFHRDNLGMPSSRASAFDAKYRP